MTGFSITPVNQAPAEDDGFPNFIQFQDEGTDLGLPTADTVDFTGAGVTVTRGTGENENKVTVNIPGGGGGAGLNFMLVGSGLQNTEIDTWATTALVSSADATWNAGANTLTFATVGVYEVVMSLLVETFETFGAGNFAVNVFSNDGLDGGPLSLTAGIMIFEPLPPSPSYTAFNESLRFIEVAASGDLLRNIVANVQTLSAAVNMTVTLGVTVRKLS